MLVGVASYFSIKVLIDCLSNWSKNFVEIFNTTYVLIVLMIYLVLLTYLIESIFSIPKAENQDYLKTYGQHARARVVTFKLAGKKNQRGFKESRMTIEYRNHLGDLTKTTLSSYMYTETQEEYINTYLCNSIYCMFDSFADYCINSRSVELTCKDCKDCCDGCYMDWVKGTADNNRSDYQQEMENFKEFDFTKDFENIKSIVYQSDTEEINGQIKVNVDWGYLYNLFNELCDKYTNKWIELHPEYYVLSFASDEGSKEQALIRNNICELVEFMKENGIESFRGENS
jgi:hypothetical protein